MRNLVSGVLIAGLFACNQGSTQPAPQQGASSGAPPAASSDDARLPADKVVASWDGGSITYGDLQDKAGPDLKKARVEYLKRAHQIEEQTLQALATQRIVEAKAKEAGVDEQEYMKSLLPAVDVSDTQIQAFYDQNQARIPGGLDANRDRIRGFLESQEQRKSITGVIEKLQEDAKLELSLPGPDLPKASFDLAGRPSKGPDDAEVTMVEFSDFECPFCARATAPVDEILKKYPEKVRVVFLHFPLTTIHRAAKPATIAAECAHRQDQFWAMHDKMFENQKDLTEDNFKAWAGELGLDAAKFEACLGDAAVAERVDADMAMGEKAGVSGTPSFFINGVQQQGIPNVGSVESFIDS